MPILSFINLAKIFWNELAIEIFLCIMLLRVKNLIQSSIIIIIIVLWFCSHLQYYFTIVTHSIHVIIHRWTWLCGLYIIHYGIIIDIIPIIIVIITKDNHVLQEHFSLLFCLELNPLDQIIHKLLNLLFILFILFLYSFFKWVHTLLWPSLSRVIC